MVQTAIFTPKDIRKRRKEITKEGIERVFVGKEQSCPNGHGMWNGDGKHVVWAFRVGFFRDFVKTHHR